MSVIKLQAMLSMELRDLLGRGGERKEGWEGGDGMWWKCKTHLYEKCSMKPSTMINIYQ